MNYHSYLIKTALMKSHKPKDDKEDNPSKYTGIGLAGLGGLGLAGAAYGGSYVYSPDAQRILDARKITWDNPNYWKTDVAHDVIAKHLAGANGMASRKILGMKPLGEALLNFYDRSTRINPAHEARNVHYEQFSKGPVETVGQSLSELIDGEAASIAKKTNTGPRDPAVMGPLVEKYKPMDLVSDVEDNLKRKLNPEQAIYQASKANPGWRTRQARVSSELATRYGHGISKGRKYMKNTALASIVTMLLGAGLYAAN